MLIIITIIVSFFIKKKYEGSQIEVRIGVSRISEPALPENSLFEYITYEPKSGVFLEALSLWDVDVNHLTTSMEEFFQPCLIHVLWKVMDKNGDSLFKPQGSSFVPLTMEHRTW